MQSVEATYQAPSADVTTEEKLAAIAAALESLDQRLALTRAEIAKLDEVGICTGLVYWRDKGNGKPKLYANHGVNQACHIHGTPEPDKRLRTYVGMDAETQAEVLAAMERCKERSDLESAVRQVEIQHSRIEREVTTAWRTATGQQRWEW